MCGEKKKPNKRTIGYHNPTKLGSFIASFIGC